MALMSPVIINESGKQWLDALRQAVFWIVVSNVFGYAFVKRRARSKLDIYVT
jgi:hypothetical protein